MCINIVDCEHKTSPIDESGAFFAVGTPAMRGNVIDFGQARRISEKTFDGWTRRLRPKFGDLLFAREAPVGPVVLIPREENVAAGQRTVLLRPDPQQLNSRFLYYLLSSPKLQRQIESLAAGSTVAHLNVADVRSLEVQVPTMAEQQAIAEVLGALDDKIAANAKLVKTLEDSFTAHWNALGSSSSAETVTLGSLVGSPIGGDWGTSESTETSNSEVLCIRGADIANLQRSSLGNMPRRFVKPSSLIRRQLEDGDLVVEMSGGSPTQSTGRAALITDALLNRLNVPITSSNFCKIVRPLNTENSFFLYGQLRSSWQKGEFFPFENGSTGIKNLAFSDYCSTKVVALPPTTELKTFNALANSHLESMQSMGVESALLAETRDVLLPQLMSGKLRVKEVEALGESAV